MRDINVRLPQDGKEVHIRQASNVSHNKYTAKAEKRHYSSSSESTPDFEARRARASVSYRHIVDCKASILHEESGQLCHVEGTIPLRCLAPDCHIPTMAHKVHLCGIQEHDHSLLAKCVHFDRRMPSHYEA